MSTDNPIRSYTWQISKAAISFLSVIIYSQFLGADGRGELSVWLLILQVTLMFNEWVMGSAMANWYTQFGFNTVIRRTWFFPILVLGISYFLALLFNIPASIFVYLALIGIGITIQNVLANYFQSTGEVLIRNKWQFSYELVKVIFLILALLLFYNGILNSLSNGVELTLLTISIAAILWVIGSLIFFRKQEKKSERTTTEFPKISVILKEGFWAQFGHLLLFLIFKAPIYFAAKYSGDSLAGVIANTLLIADTVWIFANTFGMVIHARALEKNNLQYHKKVASRFLVFSFWGTTIIAVLILLIPQNTYEWIFGNEFGEMRELWRLIFPSIIAMSLSAVVGNLLHAQNRFVELARNHFFALVIMMTSFVLMKNFEVSVKYTLLYSFDVGVVFLMIFNLLSSNIRIFNKRLWVDNTLILLRLVKIRID